jgi:hypothetical protein
MVISSLVGSCVGSFLGCYLYSKVRTDSFFTKIPKNLGSITQESNDLIAPEKISGESYGKVKYRITRQSDEAYHERNTMQGVKIPVDVLKS